MSKEHTDAEIATVFFRFMQEYNALLRRHQINSNEFHSHSHAFTILTSLHTNRNKPVTMSMLSKKLGITKQQLTKLVNDMEIKRYVVRYLNINNRRQVFVKITDQGEAHLKIMTSEIIQETLGSLANFSDAEKEVVYECSEKLCAMFKKDAAY